LNDAEHLAARIIYYLNSFQRETEGGLLCDGFQDGFRLIGDGLRRVGDARMLKHKLRKTTEIMNFSKRQTDKKKAKEKAGEAVTLILLPA
jgi:hypothetical protein